MLCALDRGRGLTQHGGKSFTLRGARILRMSWIDASDTAVRWPQQEFLLVGEA